MFYIYAILSVTKLEYNSHLTVNCNCCEKIKHLNTDMVFVIENKIKYVRHNTSIYTMYITNTTSLPVGWYWLLCKPDILNHYK